MDPSTAPDVKGGASLLRRLAQRLRGRADGAMRLRLTLAQASIAGAVLLTGLGTGALVLEHQGEEARATQDRWAERASHMLGEQLEQATSLALGARGAIESADRMSSAEFAHFAAVSRKDTHLLGLTWMPRVPGVERPGYERRTGHRITSPQGTGRPRPAAPRAVHFPITYLAPMRPAARPALGLDPGADLGVARARAAARDGAGVVLAPSVPLVGMRTPGMTMFAPVYRAGAPIRTVAERRAALRGYVAATYRLADMVHEAHQALPAGARMQIRDGGLILDGPSGELAGPSRVTLPAGGRRWEILVASGASTPLATWLTAVGGGVLVSGLVAFLFLLANRRRDESERAATEQGGLLRVATAVAVEAPPEEVFNLVAVEAAALLGGEYGGVYRFTDREAVLVGSCGPDGRLGDMRFPIGAGGGAIAQVARTGAPARVGSYAMLSDDPVGALATSFAWRQSVAAPVRVGGALWGALAVATNRSTPIPADAAARMDQFARLTAVAIADAEARDALRASEERFRTLAVHAPAGIVEVDAAGRCRFVNERWRELTGLEEADALPADWTRALHPADRDRALERWRASSAAGEEFHGEYRCIDADGRVSWVSGRAVALRDASGAVTGHLGTFSDVTERKQAEEELRSQRDYAESMVAAMQDGLVLLAPDGRITEVSRGLCELTGFAREELLGTTAPYPYWPESTPEGVQRGFERIREAGSHEWDLPFCRSDGNTVAVILRASVLRDAEGGTVGYLATVKDVTERRRAEDDLRHQAGLVHAVLNTAPEAIRMVDLDGRTVVSNAAEEGLMDAIDGGRPDGGGSAYDGLDAMAEVTTDPAAYRSALASLTADPRRTASDEFELVASGRIFRRYSAPVRVDGGGEIVGRLFVTAEVTDERRTDRAKDEFIQLASHELRTPLTSILGYLEILQDGGAGELTAEQRRFLDVVDRNAQRLVRLVGDLLMVARADAGRLGLEMESVELEELVGEAAQAQRLVADERHITLATSVAPLALRCDRGRLGEVIDNLLSNALKFTPPGGRVDVSAHAEAGGAVIEVADTGMGIPAAEQERLFERFYRTQAALQAAIPGTGLGLTISKMIVEAHGGRIGVASEEGRGTTFRMWLPMADSRPPSPGAAGLDAPPPGVSPELPALG